MRDDELLEVCREVVPRLLANRGWNLVDASREEAFMGEVLLEVEGRLGLMSSERLAQRGFPKVIEDAVKRRYNLLWYAACGDDGDRVRQQQAFVELYQELLRLALLVANHDRRIAEEGAQEALIMVWRKLDQVQYPAAFISWAGTIVRRETRRRLGKALLRRELSEADLLSPDKAEESPLERLPAPEEASPPSKEVRKRFESVIRACLGRSQQRQEVIIRRYLEEKKVPEVAQELGIRADQVSRLAHKAKQTLRKCKQFLKLVQEWWAESSFGEEERV